MFDEEDNWIDDFDDDPVDQDEPSPADLKQFSIAEFEGLFGEARQDILGDREAHADPPLVEDVAVSETLSLPSVTQIDQTMQSICQPTVAQQTVGAAIYHSHDPPSEVLTPQQAMSWGNSRFIAAMVGKKYQLVDLKHFDVVTQLYTMEAYDLAQLARFYSRYRVKIQVTDRDTGNVTHSFKNVIEYWESQNANRYIQIVFDPKNRLPSNIFNTFSGLAVEPKAGCWELFKLHLLEVICNGNREYFEYLLDYLANLFQIGERPGVAIVWVGSKGSGKGIAINLIGHIFGQHYLQITQRNQLFSNFNFHLADKLLVCVDESLWAGDKVAEGVLKGLITEPTLAVEAKYVNTKTVVNHLNLFILSNETWVVPVSEKERRFFVLRVSDKYIGDRVYFDSIIDEMLNKGGCEAMLEELLNRKVSIQRLRDAPWSSEMSLQLFESEPVLRFLIMCINRQSLTDPAANNGGTSWGTVGKESFYRDFQVFRNREGQQHPESKIAFGRKLNVWIPGITTIRVNSEQAHSFPSISDCKAAIDKELKTPWTWD